MNYVSKAVLDAVVPEGALSRSRVDHRGCRRDPPRNGKAPPMRIGEAANPGPGNVNNRATWGAFTAQDPGGAGFRDAVAPGFKSGGQGEASEAGGDEELGLFSLKIVTINITSWGSVLDFVGVTSADVLLVQEHKLGKDQAEEAVAWLRRRGWNALFTEASTGPNGGNCAGVAVLAKAHVGLGLPLVGSEVVSTSRAVAARIEPPGSRPMVVVSAYLHDGQGLARCNLDLLGEIGTFISAQGEGCPFVVGADFQNTPAHLATTAIARELGGHIMATGDANGTCRTASSAKELDYFIVSSGLADGVKSVDLVPRSGIRTHVPVALNFKPRLASLRALVVRKPPPISTERLIGPVRPVASWAELDKEALTLAADAMDHSIDADIIHQRMGDLYCRWADEAEKELVERAVDGTKMPKRQLRGRAPVMVWRSILPEKPAVGRDGRGTRWRNVATAALGLQRLMMDARAARQLPGPGSRDGESGEARDLTSDLACGEDDGPRIRDQLEGLAREAEEATEDFEACHDDQLHEDSAKGADLLRAIAHIARSIGDSGTASDDDLSSALSIRQEATRRVEEAAASCKKAQIEAWTAWIRRGIDAGARNAHRFTRVPPAWKPQPQVAPDGIITAEPSRVVAAYRAKYSKRWNGPEAANGEDRPRTQAPWRQAARCHLPRATPAQLREASRAFSHDTAVAFDGIALRHYDMMTDDALHVLASIIVAMEAVGRLPPQLEALLMPMIGKDRGGHRAITTAPSLYRLWGRLRRELSQQWEASHDRAYFAAGKGRRVQDVIWRQALRAEAGDGQSLSSATALWDLAAFYDTINRTRLWRQIVRHDYPLVIARLAFAVYDAPRALTLDGRVSCPTYARNGVPAGCPFANALSKVYVIDPFDEFVASPPMQEADDAVFDDYVDDLVVSATGPDKHVEDTIVEAAWELRRQVEEVLGCEIEVAKASVVASNPRLAARIAKRLGAYAGSGGGKASAVNLGCDYAPGRRRRFHRHSGKRHGRMLTMVKRTRRLARARRAIGSTRRLRKVFTTGLLPAAIPDAAVNGVSDQEALMLRRAAATACSPRARGRSLALVTLINQIPTWRAEVEVILQFSRQMWNASLLGHSRPRRGELTMTEIAEKWRSVDKTPILSGGPTGADDGDAMQERDGDDGRRQDPRGGRDGRASRDGDGRGGHGGRAPSDPTATTRNSNRRSMWHSDGSKREWNKVRGPVGAMLLALHRVGWSMPDPYNFVDDRGETIPLTKVTPALLAVLLKDATFRALERQIGARLAADDEEYSGRRICVDHVRSQMASDRSLTREGKAAYMSAVCGALMTHSRAVALGYLVEDLCPKCGCKGDTVRHRVYDCQDPEVVAARRKAAPKWFYDEVARRPTAQTRWTTGFVPHPADVWPAPAQEAEPQTCYDGDGVPIISENGIPRLEGQLFVDGSCSRHVIAELRRAATAIVARDPLRGTTWRIRMAVPAPMIQTSQAAEFVALPMLLAYLRGTDGQWDVASDCAGVVRDCNRGSARAIAGDRVYGGLLKPVLSDAAWAKQVSVRKVPAHVDPRAVSGKARDDALGNAEADAEAKKARMIHPQPPPALEKEVEAQLRRARLVVRAMAATLPLFPPMPKERMQKRPVARDGATIRGRGGHEWEFKAGFWRCGVCWALSVKPEISAQMVHRSCPGPKRSLEAEAITNRGHKLAIAEGALPVLFCWDCGAFSARRAYGLGARCRGVPSRAGAQAIARIRRGEQPWETREHGGRTRHKLGAAAAWDRHRGAYINADGAAMQSRRCARRRRDGPRDDDGGAHDDGRDDDSVLRQERNVRPRTDDADHGREQCRTSHLTAVDTDADMMRLLMDDAMAECAASEEEGRHEGFGDEEDVFGHGGGLDQPADVQPRRCPMRGQRNDLVGDTVRPLGSAAGSAASSGLPQDGSVVRAEGSTAVQLGKGGGAALADISSHHHGLDLTAMAKGVQLDAYGACEGPGDPRADRATVEVAATHRGPATTTVAATAREATTPQSLDHYARQATAERGEVAVGPPSGAAAPLDGRGCAGCRWPEEDPPQKRPRRLGVGPSTGRELQQHNGNGPATQEQARRRDGTVAPAPGAVARGGGDATACQGSGRPEAGLAPSTPGARNECRDEDGDGTLMADSEQGGGSMAASSSGSRAGTARATVAAEGDHQTGEDGDSWATSVPNGGGAACGISGGCGSTDGIAGEGNLRDLRGQPHRDALHGGSEVREDVSDAAAAPCLPRPCAEESGDHQEHRRPADHRGQHRRRRDDLHSGDGDDGLEGPHDAAPECGQRRLLPPEGGGPTRAGQRLHGIHGGCGTEVGGISSSHEVRVRNVDDGTSSSSFSVSSGGAVRGTGIVSIPSLHRRAAAQPLVDARGRGEAERLEHRCKRRRRGDALGSAQGQGAGGQWVRAAGDDAMGGEQLGIMPWQRPPSWLYLPSQGVHGHGHCELSSDGGRDDAPWDPGVHGAAIRGRQPTPGCERRHAAGGGRPSHIGIDGAASGANEDTLPAENSTTFPSRGGTRRKTAAARDGSSYIMDAYLERHRERVQRRQEEVKRAGQHSTATAAERMAALRRRIGERNSAPSQPAAAVDVGRGEEQLANSRAEESTRSTCTRSPGMAGAGDEPVRESTPPRRNELLKIHLLARTDVASRIRDPACEASGIVNEEARRHFGVAAGAHVAAACDGCDSTPSATADAARRAAWHAIEAADLRPP